MSRQALGNVLAGVLFLIVAIYDFTQDDSGIGVVFLVFAAVFLGPGLPTKARSRGAERAGRNPARYAEQRAKSKAILAGLESITAAALWESSYVPASPGWSGGRPKPGPP